MVETVDLIPIDMAKDLVPAGVFNCIHEHLSTQENVFVLKIDPEAAGADDFCSRYGVPKEQGANCVIVRGERGDSHSMAACLSLVGRRLSINKTVRSILNARRVALAPLNDLLEQTGMEYGSITVVGLPADWQIFIDPDVVTVERLFIGGGYRCSKLCLPGKALLKLPNVSIVQNLTL